MVAESKVRKDILLRVLGRVGGKAMFSSLPDDPPLMGERYQATIERLFQGKEEFRIGVLKHLRQLDEAELLDVFDPSGNPTVEKWETWLKAARSEFAQKFRPNLPWYHSLLGEGRLLADVNYWSKAAYLTLDEMLWLSVGFQPDDTFTKTILDTRSGGLRNNDEADFMRRRKELFVRAFGLSRHSDRHTGDKIQAWVDRSGLEIHNSFKAIILGMTTSDGSAAATPGSLSEVTASTDSVDRREMTALAKIFTVIAITEYGYDPTARRGPIPKEIQGYADRLGIQISQDSIRKYLQMGARHLPNDWTPDC